MSRQLRPKVTRLIKFSNKTDWIWKLRPKTNLFYRNMSTALKVMTHAPVMSERFRRMISCRKMNLTLMMSRLFFKQDQEIAGTIKLLNSKLQKVMRRWTTQWLLMKSKSKCSKSIQKVKTTAWIKLMNPQCRFTKTLTMILNAVITRKELFKMLKLDNFLKRKSPYKLKIYPYL